MSVFPEILLMMAEDVLEACRERGLKVTTAESCTGGLIASCLTSVPGASESFEQGFVTYANSAKTVLLGVSEATLAAHGAVSAETAQDMAEGALKTAQADLAVSVTGIAGPGGGSAEKPVGLVYMACARKGQETTIEKHIFEGERDKIRLQAVESALRMLVIGAER